VISRTRGTVDRAALGVMGLLFLRTGSWPAATDRAVAGRLPSGWPVTREGTVRPQAPAEALTARVAALPGVARDRARVPSRRAQRPEAGLRVRLEPDTPPHALLPGLRAATAEAERTVAPHELRARVRLSAASHRMPHVR
jgi:hypothetical protein